MEADSDLYTFNEYTVNAFSGYWRGPKEVKRSEEVLVAKYPSQREAAGRPVRDVDVFCALTPAPFFRLYAKATINASGAILPTIDLRFSSFPDAAADVAHVAKLISRCQMGLPHR